MRIKSLEWLWKKASLRATPPFGGAARSHATWYLVYFNAATSWWYPTLKMPRKFTSKVTTQVCPFLLLNIIKHKLELSTGNYSKSEMKLSFLLLNTLHIPWIRKGLNGKRKQGKKIYIQEKKWRCGVSNPGPSACKADALPLSYTPEKWQVPEI